MCDIDITSSDSKIQPRVSKKSVSKRAAVVRRHLRRSGTFVSSNETKVRADAIASGEFCRPRFFARMRARGRLVALRPDGLSADPDLAGDGPFDPRVVNGLDVEDCGGSDIEASSQIGQRKPLELELIFDPGPFGLGILNISLCDIWHKRDIIHMIEICQ